MANHSQAQQGPNTPALLLHRATPDHLLASRTACAPRIGHGHSGPASGPEMWVAISHPLVEIRITNPDQAQLFTHLGLTLESLIKADHDPLEIAPTLTI